tara:strand:- start:2583 stop:2816 length:234 start_codon:yes stop_codon:yes gene_type:complete
MDRYKVYKSKTKYGMLTEARYNIGIHDVNYEIELHMERDWYKHYVVILKKVGNRWLKILTIHDGELIKTKNYPTESN